MPFPCPRTPTFHIPVCCAHVHAWLWVCVDMGTCVPKKRLSVDAGDCPPWLTPWGRLCQSNPELPSTANLSGHLVLSLPCFCLLRLWFQAGCHAAFLPSTRIDVVMEQGWMLFSLSLKRERSHLLMHGTCCAGDWDLSTVCLSYCYVVLKRLTPRQLL